MATVETEQITDFFLRLGKDDSLLRAFQRDARGTLERSGLGDDARTALLESRLDDLQNAVVDEVVLALGRSDLVNVPRMYMALEPEPEPDEPR